MSDARAWTPLEIEVFFTYAVFAGVETRNFSADAHTAAGKKLEAAGLLHGSDDGWRVTEAGQVFLEMLCGTPAPVQRWVDPREPR